MHYGGEEGVWTAASLGSGLQSRDTFFWEESLLSLELLTRQNLGPITSW